MADILGWLEQGFKQGLKQGRRMAFAPLLSSGMALLITFLSASPSLSHEVVPAIADIRHQDQVLHIDINLSLEGLVAGIDLSRVFDTGDAPEAARHDALRALSDADFTTEAHAFWPLMAEKIRLMAEPGGPGGTGGPSLRLEPTLVAITVTPMPDPEMARETLVQFTATLPANADAVTFGWAAEFGSIVVRQQGVEAPYTGFLEAGATSDVIMLQGGGAATRWQAFASYIPVGFRHILPKGLDHILFVLGLFFLSTQMRPLITQITSFTVAHTITLALAALGWVVVPASIVEPLIAASIVFVAVENIFTAGLSRARPFVVFGFGLLHGLGFASVLGEFGLPQGAFIPALIGFNIGVELGQLTIIAAAFGIVGYRYGARPWYRRMIAIPGSVAIALMGAWWVIERVFL